MAKKRLLGIVFYWGLVLSILTSILILNQTEAAPIPTPKPQYGGVLKIITSVGAVNIGYPSDAYTPNDYFYADPAIETLIRLDQKGSAAPWLATAWKVSPDLKSITLTLRKGVKFHDGTDFNAEAVKYLLDIYRTGPLPELKAVASVDVVDDYTVRLNLSKFEAQLITNLAFRPGFMASPTAIKTKGKDGCLLNPVGTGPFKFVSFQRDVSLKYEKFDGYWQKGKPYLDGVEFDFIADRVTALMAFKAGKGQVTAGLSAQHLSELKGTGKYQISVIPVAVYGLAGDSSNPKSPFADIKVRRAVEHAIEKNEIAKAIGYGFFEAANQLTAQMSWYYNPAVVGYAYNPQKAKELLSQAGYPNGFKTRIIYQTTDPQDLFTAVQSYLGQIGIDVKLEPATPSLFVQTHSKGWDSGLVYFNASTGIALDPGFVLESRLSSKGLQFVSIVHPADYEAKLSQAVSEPDFNKRKVLFQEVMKLVTDEYCMVSPIHVVYSGNAKSPEANNLGMYEVSMHLWTPEDAWLSK